MQLKRALAATAAVLAATVLPFAALEVWARTSLFDTASYTNSETFDRTWKALSADPDWSVMTLGNSEVRWGFSSEALDAGLAAGGVFSRTLNLGIDGLGQNECRQLLPRLNLQQRAPHLRVAIIGVQLTDAHATMTEVGDRGIDCDSALMRPVFNSPWAFDTGVHSLCRERSEKSLPVRILEKSAVFRYRAQIRSALLEKLGLARDTIPFDSAALPMSPTGYHPHLPIQLARNNYDQALANLMKERAQGTAEFAPMEPGHWPKLLAKGDLFDTQAAFFENMGVLPVFVALPTSPERIEATNRVADYARNSELTREWAARTGRVYIDLGMPTRENKDILYSDHRHLSFVGAARYSSRLADAMAEIPAVRKALALPAGDLSAASVGVDEHH